MKKAISILSLFIITISLLLLIIKGGSGSLIGVGGVFESSGSTSRFALTEAIAEKGTLFLSKERAKFASPDVVVHEGNYFSIFTPGVSFIGVPFYLLGKLYGAPQLFTYALTALLAVLNAFLVARIAKKIGGGFVTSIKEQGIK